jgi:bacterioferritin
MTAISGQLALAQLLSFQPVTKERSCRRASRIDHQRIRNPTAWSQDRRELPGDLDRSMECGEEIKKALAADITEELMHARQLGERIKQLSGFVPGSLALKFDQKCLQPPKDTTDVTSVIEGVIDAEEGAISQYNKIIRLCDGLDYVTQDLCIRLLTSEEAHKIMFVGFLKEYRKKA